MAFKKEDTIISSRSKLDTPVKAIGGGNLLQTHLVKL